MKLKKFSSSLFGFSRRQVADYILQQNELHTQQVKDLEVKIADLFEKAQRYSHNSYILANEVKRLQGINNELAENCEDLQNNLSSVTEERNSLEVERNQLSEKANILSMECASLEQTEQALSQKIEILEGRLSECQNELVKTKSDLKIVALEYQNIKALLKSKENESSIQRDVLLKCLSDVQTEKSVLTEQLKEIQNEEKSETELRAENVRKEIAEALSEIAKSIRDDSSDYGSNYVNIG